MLAAAALMVLSACGGDDSEEARPETEAAPTETTAMGPGNGRGGVSLRKLGDFDQPLYVAQPPESDDLYVVERPGRVQLLRGGAASTAATNTAAESTEALDISDEVSTDVEQGLLSIAFAPDFGSSRLLYAYFTDSAGDQRVVEFEAAEDGTIDPGSRRELLRMEDFAANHNGGLLLFGPDERLYIGTGDGGLAGDPERNGQDLGSLLGKILRIDPRPSSAAATDTAAEQRPYGIPEDNPFVSRQGARGEIFAYGLRNPWRFSFDRETEELFIGDVGQDSQEEIDAVPLERARGANFGWSAFEGTERFNSDQSAPNHVPPVLTYELNGTCSVTGGYVVRDPRLPTLRGRYLYGDFCAGELRSFVPTRSGARGDRALGPTIPMLSSFGEDEDGRIYATSLEGPVFELVP